MAASTEQKLDYLLKKIGYTASKTGLAEDSSLSGTKKAPFAEAIPSPLVTPSTTIWNESALIPTTPPGSDTAQVRVYLAGTSGHRMTVDSTVSGSRAFIAYSTYNNTSTAILGDWIDPQFGDAYIIKVYKGDPNSGGTLLSAAGAGSNDTWFFDYSSGVLNFNGTVIPSGVTDTNIYIVGYRYIGVKGLSTAGITTSGTSTLKDLNVTGVSTFAGNINANGNIIGDNATNITGINNVSASGISSSSAFADFDYLQAPFGSTTTFTVTVASKDATHRYNGQGSGNAYLINGVQAPVLTLTPGRTYRFTNDNTGSHPLKFYYEADRTTLYTTGVNFQNTYTEITISDTTPNVLHYQCTNHGLMGNAIITNSNVVDSPYAATLRDSLTVTNNITANGNIVGDSATNITGIAGVTASTLTGTLQTAAQPNITSVGTLTSLNVNGNVSIGGTLTYEDVTNIDSVGLITARTGIKVLAGGINAVGVVTANSFNGSLATTNLTGTITNAQLAGSIANDKLANSTVSYGGVSLALGSSDATPAFNLTDATNYPFTSLTGITTVIFGDTTPKLGGDLNGNSKNIHSLGILTATTFSGDLTGTVNTAAQPNITSLGTLSSLTVSGNINANGNIVGDNATNISGINSVTATNFFGNISGVGATFTNITGTLQTASQTNITSVGTLGALTVSGNINANGNIVGDNSTNITGIAGVTATTLTGTLQTAAQTNITSVGTLGSLIVSGNINANGNIVGDNATNISGINSVTAVKFFGDGEGLTNVGVDTVTVNTNSVDTGTLNVSGISTFSGVANFNNQLNALGDVNIGNATSDTLSVTSRIDTSLVPTASGTRNLGQGDRRWHLYGENITVSGISTLGVTSTTNLETQTLNVTGVSTFANIVQLKDNVSLKFGDNKQIIATPGDLEVEASGSEDITLTVNASGGTASDIRLKTGSTESVKVNGDGGVIVTGILTATDFSGNISGVGATFTNITGTLQTAAQPNVTSLGTLTSLNVTGDVSIGGTLTYEDVTNIDSIGIVTARTGIKVLAGGINAVGVVTGTNGLSGTILTAAQTNITSVGTLSALTVSGNINANGNIVGDNATNISGINSVTASAFYGDGSNLSNVGFTTSVGTFNASSGVATIDSFAHATEDYKVAEYTLHFTNGSNIQAQKLLVMQDGTTAYSQEFAVMSSGSQLVSVDSAISGANVLVRATPESGISGTTTFRWRRIVQE